MKKRKMAKSSMDQKIVELTKKAAHSTLAIWAADCAERALPYFDAARPGDDRPWKAIEATRIWARTGVFKMSDVRGASLAAHAAAREVLEDDAARSAARAAGQAIATAHVPAHSIASAIYAATAFRDASEPKDADENTLQERKWQYRHLIELMKNK